jgi:TetR/AcrR family transcriptional regulator, regulator of autoinduction and epiphytic fitness
MFFALPVLNSLMAKTSFKDQVLRARADAILASANRLLAEKGFDSMTVDEVAADVGIAKASLYKHFSSKEELAAAAMVRLLDRALVQLEAQQKNTSTAPLEQLRVATQWTMQVQLAGEMPSLPAQNSVLRMALVANKLYMDRLIRVSDLLGGWIVASQKMGTLNPSLPAELVLYTVFAKACDPVLGMLRASGSYSDEQIINMLLSTCFQGLSATGLATVKAA